MKMNFFVDTNVTLIDVEKRDYSCIQKNFLFLEGALKFMFKNVKSPLDIFEILATCENDLS